MPKAQNKTGSVAAQQPDGVTAAFVYGALSVALLLPVLFWPLTLWGAGSLDPAKNIHQIWLSAGIVLLLCAVTADSVLGFRLQGMSPLFASFWILIASLAVSIALRWEQGAYILAAVFALHALRSGTKIWRHEKLWWLWIAWSRDTVASLSFFIWLGLLNHVG